MNMGTSNPKPKILETEVVASSRLFHIEKVHLEFSNGERRFYERMKSMGQGAVMIVPLLDADTIILSSEYAVGTEQYELTFTKGLIDVGETPEQAAIRELKEELGYGAHELIPLKKLALAPGYFGSGMHVFLAKKLYKESLEGDEPEPIVPKLFSWADVDAILQDPLFSDARSVAALFLAKKYLEQHQSSS